MEQVDQLVGALHMRNWYAIAALTLMLVVQLVRKLPVPFVSKWYARIPDGFRWLPPVLAGGATAFIAAFQAGKPLGAALTEAVGGALAIGLGAMGGAALLKESHVPWDGGAGGVQPLENKSTVNRIPPLGMAMLMAFVLGFACSSPGGSVGADATPLQASVVIERSALSDVTDPNGSAGVDYFPVCGGVAIDQFRILTARHCLLEEPVYYVDATTWEHTASGKALADVAAGSAAIATLVPRHSLAAWLPRIAKPSDGPAQLVRLRGTDLVVADTLIAGTHFDAPTEHGDSGSGVFQTGALVGIVELCDAADGASCLETGGTFTPVAEAL